MALKVYIERMNILQKYLVSYIDEDNNRENFQRIFDLIRREEFRSNKNEIKLFLYLVSKISKNHNREPNFFDKLEKILATLKIEIQQLFTNQEVFNIFKNDKRILLFLFEEEFLKPDNSIIEIMSQIKYQNADYLSYFFYEIQPFMKTYKNHEIENKISSLNLSNELFEEKRKNGKNDNYLCSLIQKDLIDEFIIYVNRKSISLSSIIRRTIFETNYFLLKRDPSLIEYAAFYGAVQIFRFLCLNRVELNASLWLYAVHGRNPDIIHLLEEYCVYPADIETVLKESIKCHHNEIAEYIKNTTSSSQITDYYPLYKQSIQSYNFDHFPKELYNESFFYDFCKYDYYPFVKTLLDSGRITFKLNKANKAATGKNNVEIIQLLIKYKGIEDRSFEDCNSLKRINIPSFIKSIGVNAFNGCSNLSEVKLPSSITSIGNLVFQNCVSLKTIEIPSSVTQIGNGAFSGCSSLNKINIPSTVLSIGDNAFWGCSSLIEINIPPKIEALQDYTFFECSSLQKVLIPYRLKSIGNFTFWGCSSMKKMLIPSSVKSIGNYAFAGCKLITEMSIPSSVKYLGNSSFERCTSLSKMLIQPSISHIGESCFSGCLALKQFKIPSSIIEIEEAAFWGCTSLTDIEIPLSVKTIGNNAFWGCSALQHILIPSSVTIIGEYAFFGCSSLKKVINQGLLKSIGKYAFSECFMLEKIDIPSSIIEIGENAFQKNCSIRKTEIPLTMTAY